MSIRGYGKVGLTEKEIPSLVCIEPTALSIQGILTFRALWRVGTVARDTALLTSQPTQAKIDTPVNSVHVMLSNLSHEELISPKALAWQKYIKRW